MSTTPTLGSLLLERPAAHDVAAIHRIYSDPRVWAHFPSGRQATIEQTDQMVQLWLQGWERDGLSTWLIRDAETGELLGNGGCSVRAEAFWNLGYRLAFEAHGRGVASAVASYAVEQAQLTRPDLPIVAYLLEHNLASARVAQKAGLTLRHRGPDAGNPDPEAVRLVFADRDLNADQLASALTA